jgi:hypothetical protein
VSGNHLFAGVITGRTTVEEFVRNPPGDVLGDRPVSAFQDSARAAGCAGSTGRCGVRVDGAIAAGRGLTDDGR